MGYEKLKDTRFISLGDGRYLPIILTMTNNSTMWYQGREVRERQWGLVFFNIYNIKTKEELIAWGETVDPNTEWFKMSNKWLVGREVASWLNRACNNAHTVEEYLKLGYHRFGGTILIQNTKTKEIKRVKDEYFRTTEELLNFIETFKSYETGEDEIKDIDFHFSTPDPLKIPRTVKESVYESFIVKVGGGYLYDYDYGHYHRIAKKEDAKVYYGKEEWEKITKFITGVTLTPISTKTADFNKKKEFYVAVDGGCYDNNIIGKMTARHLQFAYNENYAIKFATENEAKRYIKKLLSKQFSNCNAYKVCRMGV